MGFDYDIQYRSGSSNQAADTLSRLPDTSATAHMLLFVPCLTFLDALRQQLDTHDEYCQKRQLILASPANHPFFFITQGLILHKGRIWLTRGLPIITTLLLEYHATTTGGHAGVAKTLARLSENFHWDGIRDDVARFVAQCLDCQVTKYEAKKFVGLLCPLPILARPWEDLSLDFIVGLPPYHGNTVILVVIDRFSKGIHLGLLPTSHTAHMVTSLFVNIVVKLHGLPRSLVSDETHSSLASSGRNSLVSVARCSR